MPSWMDLLNELNDQKNDQERKKWLNRKLKHSLQQVSKLREDRNVISYSSSFLQKPGVPATLTQLTHEEINGFMSVMHGMKWDKNLTLLLHTPGGVMNAAETIVSYLRTKFSDIEIIVPTYAMSAGTMISLAANRIFMGKQSQLGPIDPQLHYQGQIYSTIAIIDQFDRAKKEIKNDLEQAHVWASILQSLGPALLQEAQNALNYSSGIVSEWLAKWMFKDEKDSAKIARKVANYFSKGFSGSVKKSHGRRIDRDEARSQGVKVIDLEDDQDLQEWVLTTYHINTIIFEKTPALKCLSSNHGRNWIKNIPNITI